MLEHKIAAKQCLNKKHTFIVSAWVLSPTRKISSAFVCQHCLLMVDKAELETVNQYYLDTLKALHGPTE